MPTGQRHFFALGDDYAALLNGLESRIPVTYFEAGNFSAFPKSRYRSWTELKEMGTADADASVSCRTYLLSGPEFEVNIRRLGSLLGRRRYLVDQLANPDTVTLGLGGTWRGEALLSGRVATAYDTPSSWQLIKSFDAVFRKRFVKLRSYWIGPCAMKYLEEGGRLTTAIQSPSAYDLRP